MSSQKTDTALRCASDTYKLARKRNRRGHLFLPPRLSPFGDVGGKGKFTSSAGARRGIFVSSRASLILCSRNVIFQRRE